MINAFALEDARLVRIDETTEPLNTAIWLDLIEPTIEERETLQENLGQSLASFLELEDIEASARFFEDEDGLHLHSFFYCEDENDYADLASVEQIQKVAVRASMAFTVPEIVDKVDETKKLKNQDELNRSNISIAAQDYAGDSDKGINIDDLKDNQRAGGDQVPTKEEEKAPEVHTIVEQMPVFPGGEAALLAYIASHVKYPEIAKEQDVQGVVQLRFVVLENGSIGEVQVVKSLESHCDAEAKRVVKTLPRFVPGKQQGKAVRVWYTLPIRFQIQ